MPSKRNNNPKRQQHETDKDKRTQNRYADDAVLITGNDDDYVQGYGIRKENEQSDCLDLNDIKT